MGNTSEYMNITAIILLKLLLEWQTEPEIRRSSE
jgi:hypothetical protein